MDDKRKRVQLNSEVKTTASEMKNTPDRINNRLTSQKKRLMNLKT